MTAVTEGAQQAGPVPVIGSTGRSAKLGVPDRPQVNLLPVEVTSGRRLAVVKRRMIWVLIATLVLIVVAYGLAFTINAAAQNRNEDALSQADSLKLDIKKYSPVVQVLKDIKDTQESRAFVLANEVNWTSYTYALAAVLPEGVTIDSVSMASISPGDKLVEGADELTANAIGVITFAATSPTLPVASEWIDALGSVPGLVDANLQSSKLEDEDGNVTYSVSATVQVTSEALANRTFPDDPPADDADDTATDATMEEG